MIDGKWYPSVRAWNLESDRRADEASKAALALPPGGGSGGGTLPTTAEEAGGGGDAGQSFGTGVFSPAAQAAAAAASSAPPVPAAAVAPAPPVPPAPPAVAPAALAPPARPAIPAAPPVAPPPGAVAPPPLPAAQAPPAGGAQPYNPQAHRAQMIANAMALMGRSVPAHIAEAAGLPLAGQKAALEAAAKQPYELQRQQQAHNLAVAKSQWERMDDREKQQHASLLNMTEKEYEQGLNNFYNLLQKGAYWNPQTGQMQQVPGSAATLAAPANAQSTEAMKNYDAYAAQEVAAGRTPLSRLEFQHAAPVADKKLYEDYRAQEIAEGRTPKSLENFLIDQKKSGAGTTNIINTPEGAQAAVTKARLDLRSKTAQKSAEVALQGQTLLPLIGEVLRLAEITPQGYAGPVTAELAGLLSGAGLPVPKEWSNAEQLRSLTQRLVPIAREPGATSEKELQIYLAAAPGLLQSADGRIKIAKMTRSLINQQMEVARIYDEHLLADDLHARLREVANRPIFSPDELREIETLGSGQTVRGTPSAPAAARPPVREIR